MILSLFKRRRRGEDIEPLYGAIMAEGLNPRLYAEFGVPDTFEGRFEAVTLHACLVLRRLKDMPPPAADAAQELVDRLFDGFESAMRETGISDAGVPRRMKNFAKGFYGRLEAYTAALSPDAEPQALAAALQRNLLDGAEPPAGLLDHVRGYDATLGAGALTDILGGRVRSSAVNRGGNP